MIAARAGVTIAIAAWPLAPGGFTTSGRVVPGS